MALCAWERHSRQLVPGLFHAGPEIPAGWGNIMEGAGRDNSMAVRGSQAPWPECGLEGSQTHILAPPPIRGEELFEEEALLMP